MTVIISALYFILVIAALADIITRDDSRVNHMPKIAWAILVILLPLIGSLLWFALGHDWSGTFDARRPAPRPDHRPAPPADTRSTEQQLADLDREIEEYERMRRLEAELEQRRREEEQQ